MSRFVNKVTEGHKRMRYEHDPDTFFGSRVLSDAVRTSREAYRPRVDHSHNVFDEAESKFSEYAMYPIERMILFDSFWSTPGMCAAILHDPTFEVWWTDPEAASIATDTPIQSDDATVKWLNLYSYPIHLLDTLVEAHTKFGNVALFRGVEMQHIREAAKRKQEKSVWGPFLTSRFSGHLIAPSGDPAQHMLRSAWNDRILFLVRRDPLHRLYLRAYYEDSFFEDT